jgi:RNA polymerase sigma-70 factor (ECF subfamily)
MRACHRRAPSEPRVQPNPEPTAIPGDDLAIVRRLAGGDAEAVAALYDRFAPTLLAVARRILGPAGEAEEVIQETFIQAWNQAERYDPARSSVSTWLILIARSRALDRFRSRMRGRAARRPPSRGRSHPRAEENVLRGTETRVREVFPACRPNSASLSWLLRGLSQTEIAPGRRAARHSWRPARAFG